MLFSDFAPPRRSLTLLTGLLGLLGLLLVTGCSHQPAPIQPGGATPQAATQESWRLLAAGDFDNLWKHALPAKDYATMRASWKAEHLIPKRLNIADRNAFTKAIKILTAKGAKNQLWVRFEPQLLAFRKKYQTRIPLMIGMAEPVLDSVVGRSADLDSAQKKQARAAVKILVTWATQQDWSNPAHVHKALNIVVDTARTLNIQTAKQMENLNYVQSMHIYSVLWDGLLRVLHTYGLSLDQVLGSAQVKLLSNDGNVAIVQTRFDLLGQTITVNSTMIRQNKRWFDQQTLNRWQQSRAASVARAATSHIPAQPDTQAAPATVRTVSALKGAKGH